METGLLLLPSLVWPLRVPVPLKITDAESGANLSSNSKKYPVPSGSFLSVPGDQNQALWEREVVTSFQDYIGKLHGCVIIM